MAGKPSKKSSDIWKDQLGSKDSLGYVFRKWINQARESDRRAFTDLIESIEDASDLDRVKALEIIVAVVVEEDKQPKPFDNDVFKLSIEAAIWCTTWDFAPIHHAERTEIGPRESDSPVRAHRKIPAYSEPPPLGDSFWDWATTRYHDPAFGEEKVTFAEVMKRTARKAVDITRPAADREAKFEELYSSASMKQKARMRLSTYFGEVLAPRVLSANQEIAQLLTQPFKLSGVTKENPSPTDHFYQKLLGLVGPD